MKLGPKFALSLAIPLAALTAGIGYLYQGSSRELLREELAKEGRAIALVTASAAEDYLRDRQFDDLRQLMDRITGYERVLGLRWFDRDGRMMYESTTLHGLPFLHAADLRRVLADGRTAEYRRFAGKDPALGILFPLRDDKGTILGAIQVLQLESYMAEDARRVRDFLFLLGLSSALALVAVVSLVTRYSIARPIAALSARFREVGARELPSHVPVRGNDELAGLTVEFNGMCDRLHAAQQSLEAEQQRRRQMEASLRNAERLVGLGRLAAGLAHEIGTPLNVISGRTDSILRSARGQEAIERPLRIITQQIDRISRTVRDMLDFARLRAPMRVPVNVEAALRSVLDLVESRLEHQGVDLTFEVPHALPPFLGDPDRLQQVFLNLALNAVDAMPDGGRLRVTAAESAAVHPERPAGPLRTVAVVFEDTGSGIAAGDLGHVFDPFFTTKEPGRGTGLGLSVSYGIVEEHGGWFEVSSEEGRGTRFTIRLPVPEPGEGGTA